MDHRLNSLPFLFHLTLSIALVGCMDPTQAVLDISTDAPCVFGVHTGISAGLLTNIESPEYDVTTSVCNEGGEIGSLVLVPPEDAEKNAPFAFKVVASLGAPLDSCVAPDYGPQCIVSRRAMRFVPQRPFRVPVRLSQACAGVACPEDQTCVQGTCRSVTVDPQDCDDAATCEPDPVEVPPWQAPITGMGTHMARDVAVGADGAVVMAGLFAPSVTVGNDTYTSKGESDIFLAAYAPTGFLKWSRAFGGANLDEIGGIAIGPDGSIAVLVWFADTIDFGGGTLLTGGRSDLAIAKFTAYGKLEWAQAVGGPGDDIPSGVAFNQAGDLFVVGSYDQAFTVGDQTVVSSGASDLFLLSFTRSGKLRWAKTIGGSLSDIPGSVEVGPSGDLYVTGQFAGTMSLNDTTNVQSAGGSDGFVARFDSSGEFQWIRTLASKGNDDRLMDVAINASRVVVTGSLSGAGQFGATPLQNTDELGLVASLDPTSGNVQWTRTFALQGYGTGQSIALAADGGIVVGGYTDSPMVWGSEPTTLPGPHHAFVGVLESDGTPRWSRVFGSSQYSYISAVAASPDDFVYAAGWYAQDFDTGTEVWTGPSPFDEEGFFLRLAPP